jgi:hypothetical protein
MEWSSLMCLSAFTCKTGHTEVISSLMQASLSDGRFWKQAQVLTVASLSLASFSSQPCAPGMCGVALTGLPTYAAQKELLRFQEWQESGTCRQQRK